MKNCAIPTPNTSPHSKIPKLLLANAAMLRHPNPANPIALRTDASQVRVGVGGARDTGGQEVVSPHFLFKAPPALVTEVF